MAQLITRGSDNLNESKGSETQTLAVTLPPHALLQRCSGLKGIRQQEMEEEVPEGESRELCPFL